MKKTVRIFTAAAMVILLLSLLALVICVLAQVPLASAIYGVDKQMLRENISFPISHFVGTGSYCLIAVLLFVTAMKDGKGIWVELICIVLLLAVIPFLQNFISGMETTMISRLRGVNAMAAFSSVNNLCGLSQSLRGIAVGTCLVTCGMRMAVKRQK